MDVDCVFIWNGVVIMSWHPTLERPLPIAGDFVELEWDDGVRCYQVAERTWRHSHGENIHISIKLEEEAAIEQTLP